MPKPVSEIIKDFALKAGVDAEDKDLLILVNHPSLIPLTVSDEMAEKIEGNLHSLESATPHVYAKLMNGADTHIERYAKDKLKLSDAQIAEIKACKSTGAKAEKLAQLASELTEARVKAAGPPPGKKEEDWIKEINAANEKAAGIETSLTEKFNQEKSLLEKSANEKYLKMVIRDQIKSHNLLVPAGFEVDDLLDMIYTKYTSQRLASEKLQVALDDNGRPKLLNEGGTDYFNKSNKKVDFKDDLGGFLSANKMLKTAEAQKPPGNNIAIDPGASALKSNDLQFLEKAKADYEKQFGAPVA